MQSPVYSSGPPVIKAVALIPTRLFKIRHIYYCYLAMSGPVRRETVPYRTPTIDSRPDHIISGYS